VLTLPSAGVCTSDARHSIRRIAAARSSLETGSTCFEAASVRMVDDFRRHYFAAFHRSLRNIATKVPHKSIFEYFEIPNR
jgi:hypothetical protein